MEFLKGILADSLYEQVSEALKSYNETHTDQQVKLANLGTGEYVSNSKYSALETETQGYKAQLDTISSELTTLKNAKNTDPDTKLIKK